MIKRMFVALCAVVACVTFSGCSSVFNANAAGQATGAAIYIGYTKVAENKDQSFKDKVNALWAEVNKLESIEDLVASADKLSASFDEVINSKEISDSDKATLLALKSSVTEKVKAVMNETFTSNSEAVEFLVGVRAGVNKFAGVYTEAQKKEAATAGKVLDEEPSWWTKYIVNIFSSKKEETKVEEPDAVPASEVK